MAPTAKSIRENLARAKSAYAHNDDLRTVQLIVMSLRAFLAVKPTGPDRTAVEGLLRESFANLSKMERVKKYAPNGIPYTKGQEQKLASILIPLAQKIEEDINRESVEAKRERKLRIDHAIIKGNKLLGDGNLLEAQRNYRAAVEEYVDEKGLFPFIASRLIDAGHFKASLEYIKRAVEESPDNARAYDFLLTAAGKTEDWAQAEQILLDAQKKTGPQQLLSQALSMVEARLGRWTEALSAAKAALAANPHLDEAKRVLAVATKKLSEKAASSA